MDSLIVEGKTLIQNGNLASLQEYFLAIQEESDSSFDWPTVFQTLYLSACEKGKVEIAEWFQNEVFLHLDPIQQIALRQSFSYGNYLLKRSQQKKK